MADGVEVGRSSMSIVLENAAGMDVTPITGSPLRVAQEEKYLKGCTGIPSLRSPRVQDEKNPSNSLEPGFETFIWRWSWSSRLLCHRLLRFMPK